jgi:hypothetical protein
VAVRTRRRCGVPERKARGFPEGERTEKWSGLPSFLDKVEVELMEAGDDDGGWVNTVEDGANNAQRRKVEV